MEFGTFLLLQSPSGRTSQEIYDRGTEITQAAEELGFHNMWLAKHHSTDDLLERFMVIGTPDTCIQRLRQLQEAMGIDHFNCSFWFGNLEQQQILHSMRLFATEVIPAFQ